MMTEQNKENYPIDFVIPWVNGSDPAWLEERNRYIKDEGQSVHSFDYQDWELLKYWFRGVEKYAPWVHQIFFVTWGHLPAWLDAENQKLTIIKHTDYIPPKYLPTFSSHTIELNLHRIPKLSNHFVYFNDDMYLLGDCPKCFFFKNGLPKDSAIVNPIAPKNNNCIASLQLTTAAVINENFKKNEVIRKNLWKWFNPMYGKLLPLNFLFLPWERFPGLLEKHLPSSFLKSTFEEVWSKKYDLLDQTCGHKFRDFKLDVNQWIMKEWQIASGNFEPRSINSGKLLAVHNMNDAKRAASFICKKKEKMTCINDHIEGNYRKEAKIIAEAFEKILPEKSSFEK